MIVLGIDPGTASMGYGIVERNGGRLRAVDYGCLTTSADSPLPDRLLQIHSTVSELIETHKPDLLAVERLFFSRNAQSAFGVGQARGVVLLAAAQAGIPVREATPNEVKLGVTGYGSADKEQVGRMVAVILQLPEVPSPDDTADALAIAVHTANAERPGDHLNARQPARATVMDRAAVAPIVRGETPYERSVREALARDAREAKAAASNKTAPKRP
ncbi:MAG TPA: crossover junction endodeoxyribonuclease RuvC [Candidatus Limnocylindrales bacterium]|nr:crossover junction endodeoxyribonuclease RuvC [Candidatus Limnocylindrales bacterium]